MDDAVAQFSDVTQAAPDVAKRFLEQAGGDLDQAIALFFAAGDEAADQEDIMQESQIAAPASVPAAAVPAEPQRRAASSSSGPRIGTLGGLASRDSDSDDDDSRPDLFAGGQRSGLSVQDPSKGKKGEDVRKDLLQKAQEGSLKRQKLQAQAPPPPASTAFTGSGNTLGSDEVQSVHHPDPNAPPPRERMPGSIGEETEGEDGDEDEPAQVTRTLTFWRNGFSIDDGPLMSYEEHREILEQLRDGRAPLSLLNVKFGQRVDVHIANRESEEYKEPPKVTKPFGGEGNRLGAPSPVATSSAPARDTSMPASQPPVPTQTKFEVDSNKPTTQLSIRLANGERVVQRFNHTHTVGDVQSYINASNAQVASRPYVLQTTFPNRELTDLSQTIQEANLLGSVVVMKYT